MNLNYSTLKFELFANMNQNILLIERILISDCFYDLFFAILFWCVYYECLSIFYLLSTMSNVRFGIRQGELRGKRKYAIFWRKTQKYIRRNFYYSNFWNVLSPYLSFSPDFFIFFSFLYQNFPIFSLVLVMLKRP